MLFLTMPLGTGTHAGDEVKRLRVRHGAPACVTVCVTVRARVCVRAGEDPTINGDYAAAFITGMQGDETANGYLKVSACLKHYAAYSLEGDCPGPSCRESFPAVVTAQDMEDTYLPAFQAGVERGACVCV